MKPRVMTGVMAAILMPIAPAAAQEKPRFRDMPMLPRGQWRVHGADQPVPIAVAPAATPGGAPVDAILLSDRRSFDACTPDRIAWPIIGDGQTIPWCAKSGGESNLDSKQGLGDVQTHLELRRAMLGATIWRKVASYTAHTDATPIRLQGHSSPVSFRNIWVRPLIEAAIAQDLKEDGQ